MAKCISEFKVDFKPKIYLKVKKFTISKLFKCYTQFSVKNNKSVQFITNII